MFFVFFALFKILRSFSVCTWDAYYKHCCTMFDGEGLSGTHTRTVQQCGKSCIKCKYWCCRARAGGIGRMFVSQHAPLCLSRSL